MKKKRKLIVGLCIILTALHLLCPPNNSTYDINLENYSHYAYAGEEGKIEVDLECKPFSLIEWFGEIIKIMGFK